ncbi:hypothetical protein Sa4125_17510 [Aureimonas sp. SA4125]|nr:hypothetical protein Sa4125_17510 [Aureimonas sp. SA4125]
MPGIPTIYVPGNHDFYRNGGPDGFTINSEIDDGRELAAKTGVHLLIDDTIELAGYRFLGSTLWTDLRACHSRDLAHACGEARRGMNDYRRIHRASSTRRSRRLQPSDTLAMHRRSWIFLSDQFRAGDASRTIVVTHHAPSIASLRDPFEPLNQCYASDLNAEIRSCPSTWWKLGCN